MSSHEFAKLNRKALFMHFERERQEWLEAGMNEADIFLMHFGEDGESGDYAVWLAERKHIRPDHKYCPGTPLAIDTVDPNGAWISSGRNGMDEVESQIDITIALSTLTDLQRFSFVEICLNGRAYRDVATERGKSLGTISDAVRAAKEKLKKYF